MTLVLTVHVVHVHVLALIMYSVGYILCTHAAKKRPREKTEAVAEKPPKKKKAEGFFFF